MEVEATSTENTSSSTVELHEASDDDIEAFLVTDDDETSETEEVESPAKADTATKKEETNGKQAEDPKPEPQQQVSREEYEQLKAKFEKRLKDKEQFIQRRSGEIGELRKQLRTANEQLRQGLFERYAEDPMSATEQTLQIKRNEAALEELDAEEYDLVQTHKNQQLAHQHIAPEDFDVEGMSKVLERDGMDAEFLSRFRKDPYRSMNPGTLVQLAGRLKAEKILKQLVDFTRGVVSERDQLKLKAKDAPRDTLRKIDQAAKQTPSVNAASGQSSPKKKGGMSLESMTDAELEELLLNDS